MQTSSQASQDDPNPNNLPAGGSGSATGSPNSSAGNGAGGRGGPEPERAPSTSSPGDAGAGSDGRGDAGGEAGAGALRQEGSDPPSAPVSPSSTQPQRDWKDARIAQLTAQLKEAKKLQAQAAARPEPAPAAAGNNVDLEAEVDRRASAKAAEQEFLRQCENLSSKGVEEFGQAEWDSRVNGLRQLVSPDNIPEVVAWNGLLIAAMESGEGAKVLHALGENLNEAQRILNLPAVKMTVEITKMASRLASEPSVPGVAGGEVSNAGRPVRPIAGQNRGPSHAAISPDDPDRQQQLSIDVWMKRRAEQVKERGIR